MRPEAGLFTSLPMNLSSIKVCHLIEYFEIGGLERMVQHLTRETVALGVESCVVAYKGEGSLRDEFDTKQR